MRFLIDNALSPEVAEHLRAGGHDAIHIRDRGLAEAEDEVVLDLAVAEGRVIVTADTVRWTAGTTAVATTLRYPVSARRAQTARSAGGGAGGQSTAIADDLTHGAIVTIRGDRLRVRRLP